MVVGQGSGVITTVSNPVPQRSRRRTAEVYGKADTVPFREDGDLVMGPTSKGRWSYACSKAIDEFLALAYHKEKRLPIVVARLFNTAGICRPEDHYMLAPEARLADLRRLIDAKAYLVIHAPRQTGKTTTTRLLAEALTAEGKYAAVLASCKSGSVAGNDVERGVGAVRRP